MIYRASFLWSWGLIGKNNWDVEPYGNKLQNQSSCFTTIWLPHKELLKLESLSQVECTSFYLVVAKNRFVWSLFFFSSTTTEIQRVYWNYFVIVIHQLTFINCSLVTRPNSIQNYPEKYLQCIPTKLSLGEDPPKFREVNQTCIAILGHSYSAFGWF